MEQGGYIVQNPSGTENLSPFNSTSDLGRARGDVGTT